jgi:superfamily II DNA/RNA helicase
LRIFVPQQHPVPSVSPAQVTVPGFAALGVPAPVVASLEANGITTPFPIQTATLPDSLAGRDVLGRGRTGSGKTIAFAIPTVATLAGSKRPRRPGQARALILVPTRELANQVREVVEPLAASLGLRTMTIFGGVGQGPQVANLRKGVDIVIATPGRLEDLIQQRHVRLDDVEVTVLDEADHMADLGFLPAVKRLLDATPTSTQRLLFSATLDRGVDVLVRRYLKNPVTHSVDSAASEVPQMTHHVFNVSDSQKMSVVRELVSGQGRTLAFTRTKHGAKKLAKQLTEAGVPAVDLHGNLSQGARERNLAAFGDGSVRVLVATDIAARGIHVDDITLVVHVDPPAEHKAYLHRSGRTARAGAEGIVVTVGTPSQAGDVRTLMRQASIKPQLHNVVPGHPVIGEVTGPAAEFVAPSLVPASTGGGGGGGGRRSGGGRSSSGRSGGGRSGARPQSGSGRPQGNSRPQGGAARPASSGQGQRSDRSRSTSGAAPAGSTRGAAAFSSGRRRSR